jgi:hypothetical protein
VVKDTLKDLGKTSITYGSDGELGYNYDSREALKILTQYIRELFKGPD